MATKGNPPIQVRVPAEQRERWAAAAKMDKVPLAQFIRDAVEARLRDGSRIITVKLATPIAPPATAPVERPKARRNVAATARTCDRRAFHRSGVYCKTCGVTPA